MTTSENKLEFTTIKHMLAQHALSAGAKEKLLALQPAMSKGDCRRRMGQTTEAREILDLYGNPPLTAMEEIEKIMTLCKTGAMLLPEQFLIVAQFLSSCARMQKYLEKAVRENENTIADYGQSFCLLPELREEIDRCIRGDRVDSDASPALHNIRRKIEQVKGQIQAQLASILQSKKQWLSDGAVVQRAGRYVIPVKREHKNKIAGAVVDTSGTGSTVFIEPAAVRKLQEQLAHLQIEEENEVRVILYTLSGLVDERTRELSINREAMATLDEIFAKAKLSASLRANPVQVTMERKIELRQGRHPLLAQDACVPLDFQMGDAVYGDAIYGVVITGPNTGGKTVALKTVGLLSLMAQSGLHVTASSDSTLCMANAYLCDIGDGQSIAENLSTFSSHMTNIIAILAEATEESFVFLDELGSGTDPAEGMGIAVAVLETLREKGCLFMATTHYPEVKNYAESAQGLLNARMEFNRETLEPTYKLELGKSGESCALHIAQRLGLPGPILEHAYREAYGKNAGPVSFAVQVEEEDNKMSAQNLQKNKPQKTLSSHAVQFGYGDSVLIYPKRETGIVFHTANDRGEIGVQIKGKKKWVPHKRLKRLASAADMYPEDYDFSVVFDTVENRKARKKLEKGHRGVVMHHEQE